MESVEHQHQHQHQAATRLSRSPPNPAAPPSPPLSPDSAAAAALANARWTPTKEQIGVLEGLYRQGLRTPTAEQIQQVTARLQKHGPIEGKNVFYWFQNHKARQRQRQKQQAFDYFSRQFRRPQPLPVLHRPAAHPSLPPVPLHPPPPHVPSATPDPPAPPASACNRQAMHRQQPCYVTAAAATHAAANAPYYMQAQTQTPTLYPRVETVAHDKVSTQAPATAHYQAAAPNNAGTQQPRALPCPPAAGSHRPSGARPRRPETLNLFPLHPTFAIPEKTRPAGIAISATPTPTPMAPSASGSGSFSWEPESASGDAALPLYDFFGVGR